MIVGDLIEVDMMGVRGVGGKGMTVQSSLSPYRCCSFAYTKLWNVFQELLKRISNFGAYAHRLVQFMQFPVLDFVLAHSDYHPATLVVTCETAEYIW